MSTIDLKWSEFKAVIDSKTLPFDYVEFSDRTIIYSSNAGIIFSCVINANDLSDLEDFNLNYKSNACRIEKIDATGRKIIRNAATIEGWHYQILSLEIMTSDLEGVYCKDANGVDLGFCELKLYDADGLEIASGMQEELAVETVVTLRPTHDYEVIGAVFAQGAAPLSDVRLWVTGAPGIMNVRFATGGINLRHLGEGVHQVADGRASKYLPYIQAMPNANAFEFRLKHLPGYQHDFQLTLEIFKAP